MEDSNNKERKDMSTGIVNIEFSNCLQSQQTMIEDNNINHDSHL